MPGTKRYTDRELDFVEKALQEGCTKSQVANFLGITLSTLYCLRRRYGLITEPEEPMDINAIGARYGLLAYAERQRLIQEALDKATKV